MWGLFYSSGSERKKKKKKSVNAAFPPPLPSRSQEKKIWGKKSRQSMEQFRLIIAENQLGDRRALLSKTRRILFIRKISGGNLKPQTHMYRHKGCLNWVYRHSAQALFNKSLFFFLSRRGQWLRVWLVYFNGWWDRNKSDCSNLVSMQRETFSEYLSHLQRSFPKTSQTRNAPAQIIMQTHPEEESKTKTKMETEVNSWK